MANGLSTQNPVDRESFKKYCLRRLGYGAINVNVTSQQIDDRIDDALLKFWEFHMDGTQKVYYLYALQPADFTNKYITLPNDYIGAVQLWEAGDAFNSNNIFNFRYQFSLNDLYPLTMGSVLGYWMTMTNLQFLGQIFVGQTPIRYNRHNNRLYMDMDWGRFDVGNFIVAETYQIMNPDDNPSVWSNQWLKKYATALIKLQYGENLKKHQGLPMPGGVQFSGQQIWNEAQVEIEELEHSVVHDWSLPVNDMIG